MSRLDFLLKGITQQQLGIEVAPWCNPLVPKRDGFRSLSLDVFGTEELKKVATADPLLSDDAISRIETVDLVGSADRLEELVRSAGLASEIDYIISSHNFEHLPNPVQFLKSCEAVLKPGGTVVMAIPDRRTCFDYFRPYSTTTDFLSAFYEERRKPTPAQWFMQLSLHSRLFDNGQVFGSFSLDSNPRAIQPLQSLEAAQHDWAVARNETSSSDYRDTHCWAFTPSSLELILRDIRFLNVLTLEIDEIGQTLGNEFFVRLRKNANPVPDSAFEFYTYRAELVHRIHDEAAYNTRAVFDLRSRVAQLEGELADARRKLHAVQAVIVSG